MCLTPLIETVNHNKDVCAAVTPVPSMDNWGVMKQAKYLSHADITNSFLRKNSKVISSLYIQKNLWRSGHWNTAAFEIGQAIKDQMTRKVIAILLRRLCRIQPVEIFSIMTIVRAWTLGNYLALSLVVFKPLRSIVEPSTSLMTSQWAHHCYFLI